MELDTGQLNSVLSRALGSSFGGTYPRDLIPHRLRPYDRESHCGDYGSSR